MITIVGLGVEEGDLTKKGEEAIRSGAKVILKTELAQSSVNVKNLGVEYVTLDEVYEKSRNFNSLNKNLAKAVRDAEKSGDVVYCVDGSASEDNSVKLLLNGKNVRIINGISKASYFLNLAKVGDCSHSAYSAYDIYSFKRRTLPLVVYDVDNDFVASNVKEVLSDLVGEERMIKFIKNGKVEEIPLYELDRQEEYDYTCAVVVEEGELISQKRFDAVDLHDIIVRLRAKDGCPWDKVQTPESIKMSPVEEAYELMEAVNLGDEDKILEESGDILLQSVFYAVMMDEKKAFNMTDMISAECEKMISRHTHIFGADKTDSENGALEIWERNKMKEKHQETYSAAVNDVPEPFPALLKAQKVAKRLAKGGWNFSSVDGLFKKIEEELAETKEAIESGDKNLIGGEIGDVLMSIVDLSKAVEVNAEEALLDVIEKIKKRYAAFESFVLADGKSPVSLTDEEWKYYYNRAKESCR